MSLGPSEFLAAISLSLIAGLVVVVRAQPIIGVWLVGVGAFLLTFEWYQSIVLFGLNIRLFDVVCLVLLGSVSVNLAAARSRSLPVLALLVLLLLAVARGFGSFDVQQTLNASRSLLYFLVPLAFAEAAFGSRVTAVERTWKAMATALVVIAGAYWITHGFGTYASTGDRALNAVQALIVGQAGVFALVGATSRRTIGFGIACLGAVLASQQRTAWAAVGLSVLVVVSQPGIQLRASTRRGIRRALGAALIVLTVLLAVGPQSLQRSTQAARDQVSLESGTFGWRIEGWIALLDDFFDGTVEELVIGQPMGSGFDRRVAGEIVTVSPHNMYVATLLALGGTGLVALLAILVRALRSARRDHDVASLAIISGLFVFSVGYQLSPEQGLLVGLALATGRVKRRRLVANPPESAPAHTDVA